MVLRPELLGDQSATQRELIDGVALSMIRAHPLDGVGAGNFSLVTLAPPYDAVMVDPAHAVPLLIAAESGVPAGFAWLALVLAAPVAAWRRARRQPFFGDSAAVTATLLTLAFLDHYLWTLPPGTAILWTTLGIVAARGGPVVHPAEARS
jgi:O-antigen ligase